MRVLVLCTGNSARSQMAEGLLREFGVEAASAGTDPAQRVNPLAVAAMREIGIDISAAAPKPVAPLLGRSFDAVITVCDHARQTCPVFTGQVRERVHMGFPDPVTPEDFRAVRDELRRRLRAWLESTKCPLRAAVAEDLDSALELLQVCGLPADGLADQFGGAYVLAECGGALVGLAGVERHGRYGMLRSLAVAPRYRGAGLGARLLRDRLEWARAGGLTAVYLLTITAADYFPRFGFTAVARADAPAEIKASGEFAGACPASAVLMRLDL